MKRVVLLLLVVILIGCESSERGWTLFPAPAVVKDPRLDFAALVSPEHRDTNVQVFYATTRAPAPEEYPERYTHKPGDAVRLGVAEVRLGKAGWTFEDLVASDRNSVSTRCALPRSDLCMNLVYAEVTPSATLATASIDRFGARAGEKS